MSDYDGTENRDTPWPGDEDGASEHDGRGDDELTGRDRTSVSTYSAYAIRDRRRQVDVRRTAT
ncbi:hypothetical protein [Natrinema salsiterrestre]|uniref:Uncharacterized protein n=1 Tax=Natrinema salsiterrestre TaxID=2950540 RepID=A0A9Q4L3R1_9EURY|nr:hypothetical protein [Natrinema salsiterrestre]MDF9746779.1 hypothetical protein [Natrinema salsiterrestre]